MISASSKIVIQLPSKLTSARHYGLQLDGLPVGEIYKGGTVQLPVEPGSYTLSITDGKAKVYATSKVRVLENDTIHLELDPFNYLVFNFPLIVLANLMCTLILKQYGGVLQSLMPLGILSLCLFGYIVYAQRTVQWVAIHHR